MSLSITTTLSLSSQSVANNTSTVTWKVKYSKSSSTYNNNGVKYYVNVDGNRVKSGTWKPKKGATSGTIASGTTTIKHNADGTHTQIRAYAKVYDTGFSPSSADDYSPYLSLPTIKRTYTVSYNANGGTGAPASQTKAYGVNLTLSSTVPTRTGYAFKGWATSSTSAVAYPAGGTYSDNSAVTLYAVWELLGNVRMGSYSAFRCDSNGNADDEGTWGKFTCTYILSGQGANESSVTGRYRASDGSTWTNITNIIQSDPQIKAEGVSSLSVNASCLISELSQDKSYLIELTVTDSYGNTAIASDYISQAYFTMDFLAGGKGIGIGTTASCDESVHPNGLLTCGMDADFKGELTLGTALSIANGGTGATTASDARTNLGLNKNIITAKPSGDVTRSGTGDSKIAVIKANSVGDKFTVTSGSVYVGSGISKVLVSAYAKYNCKTGIKNLAIRKNGTSVVEINQNANFSSNLSLSFAITPVLIDVTKDDYFELYWYGAKGDVMSASLTRMTIEAVEYGDLI